MAIDLVPTSAVAYASTYTLSRKLRHDNPLDSFMDEIVSRSAYYHTIAFNVVHDYSAAEEVVQEAWVKGYRGLALFRNQCQLRTWLFTVVKTTALNYRRRESRLALLSLEGS